MFKIAVLISGNGTNLQGIIDSIKNKYLNCKIYSVISDNKDALGIKRAKFNNIPVFIVDKKIYGKELSNRILNILDEKVDLIVLAGFLSILKGDILNKFKNKIINIHPSLIPYFCGEGMYGIKVHEKVLKEGAQISGATVHFVDKGIDTGAIILQRAVAVNKNDTKETLQRRVLIEEHKLLPKVIKLISENRVIVKEKSVFIK